MSKTPVRLSNAAQNDLLQIARYGDERFEREQSDRYRDKIKERLALISKNPRLYPTVNYIRKGYRRSVCGAHSIYFREEEEHVLVVRILKHQDTSASLDI
ncbi:type II toxin-antitoxin system RelE/ParE family toxin [Pelagicoccus sp. NFK12]|uniref:Type II toxin-antitoxin system RelE/ParE family toxin n=1 Tax=Pelagicoccus enzymogenes TaxID=2773457 RepID=A0A927FBM9_9BACT|nr:type II toxin-antitoxin system RelE/ParE family toxin [Pelagicoccus enzymogenes]MBD5782138.1 type II toxin-antitoxin system RelE/ParE family toxin [Pelagicoccus enzymogenes]